MVSENALTELRKRIDTIDQEILAAMNQRAKLANAFLPFLQDRLIGQFIAQTMAAHTGADPLLVESLLTDERLLAVEDSTPSLESFAATGERGVSAAFFDSNDLSGAAQPTTSVVGGADTALKDAQDATGNPLNMAKRRRYVLTVQLASSKAGITDHCFVH